jgi:squalene-hopene/tetraprenyl-beta-curcumene cyclase
MIMAGADRDSEPIRRGLTWIRSQQLQDGTWIDGWCPRYIYGTAMAVEGLMRAGASSRDPAIRRAASWLLRTQNPDGGWGEDWCGSPARSSPEHTGLALYALCLSSEAGECPRDAIENGIAWLLKAQRDDGTWGASYFVDFGFGTGFADSQLPIVWALHGLGEAIRILATPDRP